MPKTILLADDSVTIQKVVELTFMDEDYQVISVSSGTEALARMEADAPDLVIADVHMPGADGYEVCRQAKAAHSSLPVLLLVGTFEPFDDAQATAAGADGHLKKPFDSQDLLSQVEKLTAVIAASAEPAAVPVEPAEPAAVPVEPAAFAPAETVQLSNTHLATDAPSLPSFELGAETASTEVLPPEPLAEVPSEPVLVAEPAGQATAEMLPPPPGMFDDAASEPIAAAPVAETSAPEPVTEAVPVLDPIGSVPDPVVAPSETKPATGSDTTPVRAVDEAAARDEASAVEDQATTAASNGSSLSEDDVDRIARRVMELLGETKLREVAWDVVPDLAEVVIRDRLRQLESYVD